MISETVKEFLKKYDLSDNLLVAFSGGYDSMCLLNVLKELNLSVTAIHLNHNWRGDESKKEEENCKNFCVEKNINFYSETLPDNIGKNETSARDARYDFFYRCAKKFNSNVVFTAHNFEDNAETVIYRIIKGTGTYGLQGILEHRDIFYRPLLKVSRVDIEKYCNAKGLLPNKDSSNENVKYKRNLIRKKIIPLMKEINPNVIDSVNSLSDIAKEDFQLLNVDKYRIRKILVDNNIDYDRKKIEDIISFINKYRTSKSGKKYSLSNNLWLFVNIDGVEVFSETTKNNTEIAINSEGEYEFENYIFSIKHYNKEIDKFPADNENKAYIFVDKIDFILRHRKNGDIINPLGISGSQKLKKYFNEKKIPQHKKDKMVLLCCNNEVLWAAGIGLSDKIKVIDKPTHIIELRGKNG